MPRSSGAPLLLALAACASAPPRPAQPLPQQLLLKSRTETFTPDFLFALREGRLWYRPASGGEWALLGSGLPEIDNPLTPTPASLQELYADGSYLVALGDDGVFYSLRWGTAWVTGWGTMLSFGTGQFAWSRDWGFPLTPFKPPLTVNLPGLHALALSNRTKFNVGYYADGNGYPHWLDFGCDTFFALGQDGSMIHFADPWLPEGFAGGKMLTGPEGGRVRGVNLSAAASALMLIDARGEVYTRMFDFDIAGEDFYFFSYTWVGGDSAYLRVRLPLFDWVHQPRVPGRVTAAITVATVPGQAGNAARELRVEGQDASGQTGLWRKPISPFALWRFEPTGAPLSGPLLDPAAPAPQGVGEAERYRVEAEGQLSAGERTAQARLRGFNPYAWQPARVDLGEGGALRLDTHDLHREPGGLRLRGALALARSGSAAELALGGAQEVEVVLHLAPGRLTIEPASGQAFRLEFAAPATLVLE